MAKGGRGGKYSYNGTMPKKQLDIENTIRGQLRETGYFLDENGNVILKSNGDEEEVNFDYEDNTFNRLVERAVWDDKTVHMTHNHPEDTIFSPEDVEAFVSLGNKSESAVTPVRTFRLIREQPRNDNSYELVGEELVPRKYWSSKYSPEQFTEAYDTKYTQVYTPMYEQVDKLTRDYKYGRIDHEAYVKQIKPYDDKLNKEMIKWLKKNAKDYGFRFVEE